MSRNLLLQVAFVALGIHLSAADRPPNLIFVLADDLGYGNWGVLGRN